jgi:ribose transport system ATP-binding protein
MSQLGATIDLGIKVKHLTVAEQQMVEIAKALCIRADIMIMDEPSAVVSGKELDTLFEIIRTLKAKKMAIIYISHRIDEIFEIADRATVLKDGELVGTISPRDADKASFVKMMVGRTLSETFPSKEKGKRQEILSLREIKKGRVLQDIFLSVYSGEILGIAGLVGSGRTDIAKVIFGVHSPDSGKIIFRGQEIPRNSPRNSLLKGIGFVTEDRKKEGIFPCLSMKKNLTALILEKIQRWSFIKKKDEKEISYRSVRELRILPPELDRPIELLSGGNQQKVVLSKWLNAECNLVILDEPTRGIDVGAKAEFYTIMRNLAKNGAAVIMISSELPEIIGMSDRIVVMHEGRMVGELSHSEATEEIIMSMATNQVTENREGDKGREC